MPRTPRTRSHPLAHPLAVLSAAVLAVVALAACGGDSTGAPTDAGDGDRPVVVATTTILGEVVGRLVGEQADVVVILPLGASPHEFQASARQVAAIGDAAAVVANGAGFEEGLASVLEAAAGDGVPVRSAIDGVATIAGGHDHDDDPEHDEHEHDEHEHEHDDHGDGDGVDPHFFTSPLAVAEAVPGIADHLAEHVPGIDRAALDAAADALVADLDALADEVAELLDAVPAERRVLVTDHDVFAYFARDFDFEVVGTVIPGGSTADGVSGGDLAALARTIDERDVPAVFTDSSAPADLVETLADEAGIVVVPLFAESLGAPGSGAETYADLIRTDARRIADALAG